jgi:hypothetical protein
MCWPVPGEKPAVKTTILEDDAAAKRAAEQGAKRMGSQAGSGTWTGWTDGSRMDNGRVAASAVCLNRDGWTAFRSYIGLRQMQVFDPELWAIGLTLRKSDASTEALRTH